MRHALFVFALVTGLVGCPSTPRPTTDGGGGRPCTNDGDCADAFDCTITSCGVGGICTATLVDSLCAAGEHCSATAGCTTMMTCTTAADCVDAHACTVDNCGIGAVCTHMAVHALCAAPTPFCDTTLGCVAGGDAGMPGCTSSAECADAHDCTIDTCGPTGMCVHNPMDSLCTEPDAICNPDTGCFVPMPCTIAADCDDGNFCNGDERCQPEFGCVPALAPRTCDDTNPCTTNVCDTTANMCIFDCEPGMLGSPSCASTPQCTVSTAGCEGRFRLEADDASVIAQSCASGMVDFDFSEVTFMNVGPGVALTVTPIRNLAGDLSDNTAPVCPMIDARAGVSGGCPEQYILRGMFVDDDTFMGTFQFNGGGGF